MALLHFRKVLSSDDKNSDSEGEHHACRSNSDSDDCFNAPLLTEPHHRMPAPLIAMLFVLGLAFLMLSYLAVARFRNTYRRRPPVNATTPESDEGEEPEEEEVVVREDEDQGLMTDHHVWYIRTVGFPQSVINSIAVFTYKRGEGLIESTDCSVCLNEFEEDDTLRLLPKCSHAFHLPCIDTWLRAHKNCPVCRAPIMALEVENGPGNSREGGMHDVTDEVEDEFESGHEREEEGSQGITGGIGNGPTMPVVEDIVKSRHGSNSGNGNLRVVSDLGEHRVKIDQELKRVRRSVSMDFSPTLKIANKEGYSGKRACKNSGIYRLIKSASFGRSLQKGKGPVLMKRTLSFSGRRKNNGNSRSQNSTFTPDMTMRK